MPKVPKDSASRADKIAWLKQFDTKREFEKTVATWSKQAKCYRTCSEWIAWMGHSLSFFLTLAEAGVIYWAYLLIPSYPSFSSIQRDLSVLNADANSAVTDGVSSALIANITLTLEDLNTSAAETIASLLSLGSRLQEIITKLPVLIGLLGAQAMVSNTSLWLSVFFKRLSQEYKHAARDVQRTYSSTFFGDTPECLIWRRERRSMALIGEEAMDAPSHEFA